MEVVLPGINQLGRARSSKNPRIFCWLSKKTEDLQKKLESLELLRIRFIMRPLFQVRFHLVSHWNIQHRAAFANARHTGLGEKSGDANASPVPINVVGQDMNQTVEVAMLPHHEIKKSDE